MRNLLYGLMLPSGNDAAMAIARYIGAGGGKGGAPVADPVANFTLMMNNRARQLGLNNTHFVNPHGLDRRGHLSSAYDLASLTWYAMQMPLFREIVRLPGYEVPGHSLRNINKMLLTYPGAEGVKTGYTRAAGLCLITSATRDGRTLISVVLNAPQWYTDSTALLDYGFRQLAAQPRSKVGQHLKIAGRKAGNGSPSTEEDYIDRYVWPKKHNVSGSIRTRDLSW